MDKKLTPLEALREMYQVCLVANVADMSKHFELIENALNRGEICEILCKTYIYFIHDPEHEYTVSKLGAIIKANEIIFKKEVNVYSLKRYLFRRETSVHVVPYIENLLTKEEIEIMKEAFKDE